MIRKIIDYYPDILKPYREIMGIADGDQWLFSRLWDAADQAFDDQFVTIAGEYGISRWEKILNIYPGAKESLEDRRFRILSRLNEKLPFTIRMLRSQLDELCGEGNAYAQLEDYFLYVGIRDKSSSAISDIQEMLLRVVPVNLVISMRAVVQSEGKISVAARGTTGIYSTGYPYMPRAVQSEGKLSVLVRGSTGIYTLRK